jgi:hypothetical protein
VALRATPVKQVNFFGLCKSAPMHMSSIQSLMLRAQWRRLLMAVDLDTETQDGLSMIPNGVLYACTIIWNMALWFRL